EQVKEQVREIRIGSLCDSVLKDVQQSLRSLRQSAGSTVLAIGTLGLGLGAATLIFSVFYSVLLQPLPFRNPEQLVQVWETRTGHEFGRASFSRPNFWDVSARNKTFESMGAMLGSDMNMTGAGDPEHVSAAFVSARFFHVLGVTPIVGHGFEPLQDRPGHDGAVVLLSNKFWRSRFASSRNIPGTTIHLDGRPYTIIGALPEGEPWLDAADVFLPMVYSPDMSRGNFEASVIGRLAPGVSISVAHDDLQRVARGLSETYREDRGMGILISPSEIWGASPALRRALWVLLGAVSLLLLIACVNIANLLLAKGSARSRELRVREALGASRLRIIRLLLTESVILGFLGAALGLLIAYWGLDAIRAADLSGIPRISEIRINGWVLGFALVATFLSGILSGLMPAAQSSSGNIAAALREGGRTQTASRAQNRIRAVLVTAEVALSIVLLIGAGLLIRSFGKLLDVNRGFDTANRTIAAVNIPFNYDDTRAESITRTLLERVRALPGVEAAATTNSRPITGWDPGMTFGAQDSTRTDQQAPWASWRFISTGYFRAMGIRLLKGRTFTEQDSHDEARRVIISGTMANLLWPGKNPIGRTILLWKGQGNRPAEVIGVADSIRDHGLDAEPTRTVYIPFYGQTNSPVQLIVHGTASPGQIASSLRSILASIDPKIPISEVETMDQLVSRSLGSKQLNTALFSAFALVALLLSMSGIYGVLSYSVARRISEIGIRVALGADRMTIFGLILRQGMRPVIAGTAIGLAGSLAVTRLLGGLLFEVKPADLISYATVTLLIGITALIACVLPARRALRVDPVTALRED
ncbi:MAG TPA: ABC transporter permease, partial [Bryobacteraceae bacterium]|nr:ABC transporter permease [Bryobacteraceae bacterium]